MTKKNSDELEKIVHGMSNEEIEEYLRAITNMRMLRKVRVGSVVLLKNAEKGVVTRALKDGGSICGFTLDGGLFYCNPGEYSLTGDTVEISHIFEELK